MASKGPRKANGGFDLSQSPSHLLRRCVQYANELFSREPAASDLTKQQFTVLAAVEQNEGVSQTDLVATTGIDRSTLAEMIRRMIEKGLLGPRTHRGRSTRKRRAHRNGRKESLARRPHRKRPRGADAARQPEHGGPREIFENAVDGGLPRRKRSQRRQ